MKLLVTGALRITPEESAELENLGYEIYFMPDERVAVPDNIPCEEIEAIICNGLFLYTPPDKFPKLRTVQLTSAGLDRVPMDYMDAHGIKCSTPAGSTVRRWRSSSSARCSDSISGAHFSRRLSRSTAGRSTADSRNWAESAL